MSPDTRSLTERVSAETGLEFTGSKGLDGDGSRWFQLLPAGHPAGQTFTLRTVVGWRHIFVSFRPGNFAGELMAAMGSASEAGRSTFCSVLGACHEAGAEVHLKINGVAKNLEDETVWLVPWRSLELDIRRGMLNINEGNPEADMRQIELWTSRAAAAVFALLPVEETKEDTPESVVGLPEGAKIRIEANRYERDRRNRAAALAIHGYNCSACGLDMGKLYGAIAAGMIEVHHVTPVSEVGSGYIINPKTDLIPLCPNCHAVAHRRSPPLSVTEIRLLLQPD